MITIWKTKLVVKEKREAADQLKAQEILSAAHYLATTHMIRRGFDQERYLNCKNVVKELGELSPLLKTLLTSTIHHYKIMFHLY